MIRLQEGGASSPEAPADVSLQRDSLLSGDSSLPRVRARRCQVCLQVYSGEARFCPFDGERLVDAPDWDPQGDSLIAQTVDGRYKVLSVLGEGETGKVYKVQHVALGRRFALKVLRRDFARDAEMVARFMREAQAAAAIGHPNIIAVSDFGELSVGGSEKAELPYFVMEFLAGMSLSMLLESEGPLTPARAGPIFLQAASALSAAHAVGVIHRNLKPANIFVTKTADQEFVKLLDFGVAKIVGAGRLTKVGMISGTPHYMSPEQVAGQPIDQRVDIYALGVIMYECFTGRVPFEADTFPEVLRKHSVEPPQPIESLVPDPKALGAFGPITMRCLAKSPKDRFGSMAELAAALETELAPIVAASTRARARISRRGRAGGASRAAALRWVGIGAGLLLAGLVGWFVWKQLAAGNVPEQETPRTAPTSSVQAPPQVATAEPQPPAQKPTAKPRTSPQVAPATAGPPAPLPSATRSTAPGLDSTKPSGAPAKPAPSMPGELIDPWGPTK